MLNVEQPQFTRIKSKPIQVRSVGNMLPNAGLRKRLEKVHNAEPPKNNFRHDLDTLGINFI